MKKTGMAFLAIVMLVSMTSLSSCSKDKAEEEHVATTSDKIVAKWTLSQSVSDYTFLGESYSETVEYTEDDTIEFKADGTLVAHESGETYNGNWSVVGEKLFITNTGEYDNPDGYEIKVLSTTDLHLFTHIESSGLVVDATLKLKK